MEDSEREREKKKESFQRGEKEEICQLNDGGEGEHCGPHIERVIDRDIYTPGNMELTCGINNVLSLKKS